jgi:hypothetical protein
MSDIGQVLRECQHATDNAEPQKVARSRFATRFAAVHESAFGTKQTLRSRRGMSSFGGKAEIAGMSAIGK